MPWWAITYLALFGIFSLAGLADDRADGHRVPYLAWGALALIADVWLVAAFFHAEVAKNLDLGAVALLVLSVSFATTSAAYDLWSHREEPDDERGLLPAAVVVTALFHAPAFVLGGLVVVRSLTGRGLLS